MIEVEGLTKRFGDQLAVDHVSFAVPTGQIVGLLGPNGAGKTTIVRMLSGQLLPSAGTARMLGLDVLREPLAVKRVIGVVPESGAVFESLTGWEYLAFVAALHQLPEAEAAERIGRFGAFFELDEPTLREKPLAAYSKGMRQKVVIAAALLHNPKVIIFDEPLSGLDANAALSFKTLITTLAREGRTIVYCSHILDVVERVCERVIVIHRGAIVADGEVAALLAQTGEPTLERVFNRLTATENLLERAEEFARALGG